MSTNGNNYLDSKLAELRIKKTDEEANALQAERKKVEELLRKEHGSKPTIKYGGSHAKGTMVRDSYDLDILCYFEHDDDSAGATLEEIYLALKKTLAAQYDVSMKRSALRLRGKKEQNDFHIDVVPGRFVDDKKDDVFLHQNEGSKVRLKTNPDTHISHIRDSGQADVVCLLKVWCHRYNINVKTFVLELAAVNALKGTKKKTLEDRLTEAMSKFRDSIEELTVEDPANPRGNDLNEFWSETIRTTLSSTAKQTLKVVAGKGWEPVFGALVEDTEKSKPSVASAAKQIRTPTKPWLMK